VVARRLEEGEEKGGEFYKPPKSRGREDRKKKGNAVIAL